MQSWQKQVDGRLVRMAGALTMIVQPNSIHGAIRFILLREAAQHPGFPDAMIVSGYEESVGGAMAAVERIAGRLTARTCRPGSEVSGQVTVKPAI